MKNIFVEIMKIYSTKNIMYYTDEFKCGKPIVYLYPNDD